MDISHLEMGFNLGSFGGEGVYSLFPLGSEGVYSLFLKFNKI